MGNSTDHDEPDAWERDARQLLAEFGDTWEIVRAPGDPLSLICERTRGTETYIVAGTPTTCLRRIRELPAAPPPGPIDVRGDAGAWISGMQQ